MINNPYTVSGLAVGGHLRRRNSLHRVAYFKRAMILSSWFQMEIRLLVLDP